MKAYGEVDIYIHVFLTSALVGGGLSASRPGRFTPGEKAPSAHYIGVWVSPRTGLDDVGETASSRLIRHLLDQSNFSHHPQMSSVRISLSKFQISSSFNFLMCQLICRLAIPFVTFRNTPDFYDEELLVPCLPQAVESFVIISLVVRLLILLMAI
jgi:hypothetical protein